jgi:hypothetical protein
MARLVARWPNFGHVRNHHSAVVTRSGIRTIVAFVTELGSVDVTYVVVAIAGGTDITIIIDSAAKSTVNILARHPTPN